ncbi:enoyl-CoA hydratase EchA19-like [Ruditapes philippinarum]|uniref:enoyl-CoA hydratase EchA19-like n=1 Tax=Ruditapes philippinarum TaxID=129788 RepID=UPI00295B5109|nr:enoyl-CoA hydratase EchA19-like [Ruditapes philippinarum]
MLINKLTVFRPVFGAIRAMTASSNDGSNNILIQKCERIMRITINRPEKRNAVNPETATELFQAFKNFEEDEDSLVAILHGTGGNFCAGYDLTSLANTETVPSFEEPLVNSQGPMGPSRMCFSKPVIACIEGYAVAGGLELALMCDLRVVDESAVLGVFCRRFGVPLLDGGTVRLQKLIGLSRAMDLILTGRSVSAQEAGEMGLANVVAKTGSGLSVAMNLAGSLLKYPQRCMNADRQSAYYAAYNASSQQDALKYEFENGVKVLAEESIPGAKRFTEGIGKHGSFKLYKPTKPKL